MVDTVRVSDAGVEYLISLMMGGAREALLTRVMNGFETPTLTTVGNSLHMELDAHYSNWDDHDYDYINVIRLGSYPYYHYADISLGTGVTTMQYGDVWHIVANFPISNPYYSDLLIGVTNDVPAYIGFTDASGNEVGTRAALTSKTKAKSGISGNTHYDEITFVGTIESDGDYTVRGFAVWTQQTGGYKVKEFLYPTTMTVHAGDRIASTGQLRLDGW